MEKLTIYNSNLSGESDIESAEGPWLITKSGERLFDLSLGSGTLIWGHEALPKELFRSPLILSEMTNELVNELIDLVGECVPFDLGGIGFQTSGALAIERACRLARVVTGRELVAVIGSFWHGALDSFLFAHDINTGQRYMLSDGVPLIATDGIRHFNSVDDFLESKQLDHYACVLVESRQGANPEIPNLNSILELGGRQRLREGGVLLVLDEIVCGFRTNYGCSIEGRKAEPDIVVFGKPIGMGYPVGLVAARKFDEYKFYQKRLLWGGTFAASPLQIRCVTWALSKLKTMDYSRLTKNLTDIVDTLGSILHDQGYLYSGGGFARVKADSRLEASARAFLDKGNRLRVVRDQLRKQKMFMGQNGLVFSNVNNIKECLDVG